MHFLLPRSGHFLSSTAFSWSSWEQYMLELFDFLKGVHNRGLPSSPTIQHHLLWMKTGLWYTVDDGSFHLPHNLFRSTLLYSIHFLSPITTVFKTKDWMFSLCLSRELHVEIQSRGFLSYVRPKHQRDEHNQAGANDCQCLIQICWLSPE